MVLPCVAKSTPISTVDIVSTGNGANEVVTVWGGGLDGLDVYGGVYMLEKTGGTYEGNIWPDGPIAAFCAELTEDSPQSTLTYDVLPLEYGPVPTDFLGGPMGGKADYIVELWGRFYNSEWAGSGPFIWQQDAKAAAFATAIWEIVYEDLPESPAGWDVTVDGTLGSLGFYVEGVDGKIPK